MYEAASRRFNDCEKRYLTHGPEPPEALTSAGPLGGLLRHEASWWSARELRWLLKDSEHRAAWADARTALPVAIAYEARDRRFRRKLGLRAAEHAYRAASDALDELGALIVATPARSPVGLAVQARVVKLWGKPEWWSGEPSQADIYERFAARMLDLFSQAARESADRRDDG